MLVPNEYVLCLAQGAKKKKGPLRVLFHSSRLQTYLLPPDDAGGSHRHGDVRQGSTGQGSTGQGDGPVDGVTREDVALKHRSRHGRADTRCPEHVGWLPAVGHDYREVGARERAIDEENPDPIRGPFERQRASLGDRVDTVDTGRKNHVRKSARQPLGARRGPEHGVGAEEVSARLSGGRVGRRGRPARNRTAGIGERSSDAG